MKTGDIYNSCEQGLTLGYSERWRHVEERGTSKVSYHRRAGGCWDGFLVLLSSHDGGGAVTWVVPSHVPAKDGNPNNGLESKIGSANGSGQISNSYQNQKYGKDQHPTTEATLPTFCFRQPGAKPVHQKAFDQKIVR